MSINPETDLDLEKLFLPAWAQQSSDTNRYAKFTGNEGAPRERRDDRSGPRPPRRDGGGGGGRGFGGPRREGQGQRGPGAPGGPGGPRREGGFGGPRRDDRGPRRDDRGGFRGGERREPPPPLPEIYPALIPDEKGVESLARQIKMTGRAFPLFDIAHLILQKPERYTIKFATKKNDQGQIIQPLFLCALDDTLWLSEDEAVVKQWIEEQSWKVEYICLNVPEPLKLPSREEVERHFRATHKDTIIKAVESHTISGVAARGLRGGLGRVLQDILAQQRRFPMQIATSLSQAFAKHGLQFFKVNKTVTHVSVARPHFLDLETTLVSDAVKQIVEFINAHPKCNRRQLIEALAPSPAPAPIPVLPAAETPVPAASTPPAEGGTPSAEATPAPATPAAPPAAPEPTPEQTAIIADLHWLVHQGHVIEFANGLLETAKKPLPRPTKPEKKPAEAVAGEAAPASAQPAAAEVPAAPAVEAQIPATETATETLAAPAAAESPVGAAEAPAAAEVVTEVAATPPEQPPV